MLLEPHMVNKGQFKKGQIPWNKGRHYTEEERKIISESTKRVMSKPEIKQKISKTFFKKGQKSWNKGKHSSEETIKKQRESWRNTFLSNPEVRKKMSESHKGQVAWNKGKRGVMPIPWNKGKKTGKPAWNSGKPAPWAKNLPQAFSKEHPSEYQFKRGHVPWSKGKHQSEEWKRKIGMANLGKRRTEEEKKKIGEAWRKAFLSHPEMRKRMSESHIGHKASEEAKSKLKRARAKQIFPVKDSKPELKIQRMLKQLNIEFIPHKYMQIEHAYCCDIFIPSINLVVEVDGDYWHGNQNSPRYKILNKHQIEQKEEDTIRTKELIAEGFKVLRLWETDVKKMDIQEFSNKIKQLRP